MGGGRWWQIPPEITRPFSGGWAAEMKWDVEWDKGMVSDSSVPIPLSTTMGDPLRFAPEDLLQEGAES
jgi:hypothetical protein